jgi:NAD+ synthase (glutamine-hydrolysing)
MKKKTRFAVAQMNPTVGDLTGNTKKIIEWIFKAEHNQADMIVFPEVALSGYPVWDLANKEDFVAEGLRCLNEIVRATGKLAITTALGFIDRGEQPHSRSYNAQAWIAKGRILTKYYKRLLPTYDVFLEDIFFQPGHASRVIPWRGFRVGPSVCEDIWDDRYDVKPLRDLFRQKADLTINISASPFYVGVDSVREKLVKQHVERYHFPMLYVNQVGAQDDLIFDGRSFFVDASGKTVFRAPAFEEGLFYFDWDPADKKVRGKKPLPLQTSGIAEMYRALVLGVRDYCRKNGFKKAVIGLSGGIDSALVAAIAADALGPGSVKGITMPGSYSSTGSWDDAEDLAKRLGIEFHIHPIRDAYHSLINIYRNQKVHAGEVAPQEGEITLAMENLQARLRGLNLMFISNDEGCLLLSTGNKSELAMGYCTLYGDMAGGLSVLGDVLKTDVYRLAHFRNTINEVIPANTLNKPPSAELRPNQKDQDSLPPYEVLDEILRLYIEKNKSRREITQTLKKSGISGSLVTDTIHKVDHNEYKRRQAPPILRVTPKAWFGRRMPITNLFH